MGITLELWRARIGGYSSNIKFGTVSKANKPKLKNLSCIGILRTGVLTKALCLILTCLLLQAGDVERNPGPTTKRKQNEIPSDNLNENIASILQVMDGKLDELNKKVDNISSELSLLKTRLDNVEDYQHVLEEENSDLKKKINSLEGKVDN